MAKNAKNVKTTKTPKASKPAKPEVKTAPPAKVVKKSTKKAIGAVTSVAKTYVIGATAYNPRVQHTAQAWNRVVAMLEAAPSKTTNVEWEEADGDKRTVKKAKVAKVSPKGKATHAELCAALGQHSNKLDENHHDFIGYMVRRNALAEVAAK
jgi:hypothetical protein